MTLSKHCSLVKVLQEEVVLAGHAESPEFVLVVVQTNRSLSERAHGGTRQVSAIDFGTCKKFTLLGFRGRSLDSTLGSSECLSDFAEHFFY